jgi:hypothetical protein
MSTEMDEEIKRWTARRKSAPALDIIQGKTMVSGSSRQFDLPPSEIDSGLSKAGMKNALKAKPEDIRMQYGSRLKWLKEAYGEAMLELRTRKVLRPAGRVGQDMILLEQPYTVSS